MVKEVEELIKIVGKGNLLEALFIRWGSYQHAGLKWRDHRNHFGLPEFIGKEKEPLDKYFNLKFSLQGLFLIYAQAYRILIENVQLNTQEVIDKIYMSVSKGELEEQLSSIISGEQSTEDQKKLKLLNILANPKGKTLFNNNNDFEKQVLNNVKKLLKINYANEFDKEFSLCKEVIDHYYSIHNIKVDKDIALLFSSYGIFSIHTKDNDISKDKDILSLNQYINEKAKMINTPLYFDYIVRLSQMLSKIELLSRDGTIKYTADCENMDWQEEELKMNGLICPINTKNTLEQLLKNQNSDEFEQLITSPENIYYSVLPEENEYRPDLIVSKKKEKDHKNTVCKLILGMFVLSVGLYVADYFFMEQKLFNSIKNVLPQDNLTNLIVGAVLTIVIVYALFQLSQKPPLSTVDDVQNTAPCKISLELHKCSNLKAHIV
ncbi:WD1261 family protein [Wolbachia endosymbiont of Muscidifurax uniraptor]